MCLSNQINFLVLWQSKHRNQIILVILIQISNTKAKHTILWSSEILFYTKLVKINGLVYTKLPQRILPIIIVLILTLQPSANDERIL